MGLEMPRSFSVPSPADLRRAKQEKETFTQNPFEQRTRSPEEKLEAIFDDAQSLQWSDLTDLLNAAEHDESLHAHLTETFSTELGPKFGPQLLDDWEYRGALKDTYDMLRKTLPDSSVPIYTEGGLKNLVAIHDMIGSSLGSLLQAQDMRRHIEEPLQLADEDSDEPAALLSVGDVSFDPSTGEYTTSIELGCDFVLDSGEIIDLQKRFERRELPPDQDGNPRYERVLIYDFFTIPDRLQSRGYAAREMAETVEASIEAKIDRLALHANIDVGGYAWAAYGFGWDERATAYALAGEFLKEQADNPATFKPEEHHVGQVAPDIAYPNDLNDKQIIELTRRTISDFIVGRRSNLKRLLVESKILSWDDFAKTRHGEPPKKMPEDLQAIWYALNEMELSPETATPQKLAELGSTDSRRFTKPELSPKPLTTGKAIMLNSSWYGSVDLQTDNTNRQKLLERLRTSSRV